MARLDMHPNAAWRFARITPQASGGIRTTLSFPLDNGLICTLTGGSPDASRRFNGWEGYCVEVLGVKEPEAITAGGTAYPFLRIWFADRVFPIQLWQQAARPIHSRLYVAASWHPEFGETLTLAGLSRRDKQQDIVKAWKGLELLSRRPEDIRTRETAIDPAYFKRELPKRYAAYFARQRQSPSQEKMAQAFGVSLETFKRYLVNPEFGVDWQSLRETALRDPI